VDPAARRTRPVLAAAAGGERAADGVGVVATLVGSDDDGSLSGPDAVVDDSGGAAVT
jgi:hypothetical protein